MINLADEKKRLAELEAEYERKHGIFGDQKILGQIEEAKRWITLLENENDQQTGIKNISVD